MLATNVAHQRNVRADTVLVYAKDMKAKLWKLTGEPIVVANGMLVNGQHRLHACVRAGVPFTTAVLYTDDESVFDVVDSGVKRTVADALTRHSIQHRSVVAASVRLVLAYESGQQVSDGLMSRVASREEIMAEAIGSKDTYEWASRLGRQGQTAGFNKSAITAFAVLLSKRADDADQWISELISGSNLEDGDPRLAVMRFQMAHSRRRGYEYLAALIRARNAYVEGRSLAHIKVMLKGQSFPRFVEDVKN